MSEAERVARAVLRLASARGAARQALLCACVAGATAVALLALSGWFLAAAAAAGIAGAAAVAGFNYLLPSAAIRLLAILRTGARYGERLLAHRAALGATAELRATLFARLAAADSRTSPDVSSGDASARLLGDVEALEELTVRRPARAGAWAGALAGIAAALFAGWQAAFALALMLAALGPLVRTLSAGLTVAPARAAAQAQGDLRALYVEYATARAEIAAYGLADRAATALAEPAARLDAARARLVRGEGWLGGALALYAAIAAALVLALAHGSAAFAALGALGAAAAVDAMGGLARSGFREAAIAAALARLDVIARLPARSTPPAPPQPTMALELTIGGATFAPATRLAIVGPSGSGKTRLLEALAGLRPALADRAAVRLGGVPLADADAAQLHTQFALAPQEAGLIAGTVADNLRVARPGRDRGRYAGSARNRVPRRSRGCNARRPRYTARRTRRHALGRRAQTARARPRAARTPPLADPRRADRGSGHRDGGRTRATARGAPRRDRHRSPYHLAPPRAARARDRAHRHRRAWHRPQRSVKPKLLSTLRGYTARQFAADTVAGITVAVVALPLSIAIAIASGAPPAAGLVTAILGGFLISLLGGSRVQIGGPTGAFIVIVYGVIAAHGMDGLRLATLMAGAILVVGGILRLGRLIRYIPEPVIDGFTIGIAIVIAASQLKDVSGLRTAALPAEFAAKLAVLWAARATLDPAALGIGIATIVSIVALRRWTPRLPGMVIAVVLASALSAALPVDTVFSRFGALPHGLAAPTIPPVSFAGAAALLPSALTIALLAGIESLLSAVVADRMMGGAHRSSAELIAQGVANLASPLFGGLPATGAIARTATNVRAGGRTPAAGLVHALVILALMLFAAPLAGYLAMPALAGLLIVTAWTMTEPARWPTRLRSRPIDLGLLFLTIALTVLANLTVAIAVGTVMGIAVDRIGRARSFKHRTR